MKRWSALLFFAAAIPFLQMRVDTSLGDYRAQEEILYMWKGEQVKRLCPGFESLMADIYWIRTVQYFGGKRAFSKNKRFDLLEPLIDITLTLDPTFEIVYRYGALFLSEPPPSGAGRPDRGVALLDRGAKALPRAWFLQQLRGFFAYYFLNDAARAAASLQEAGQLPDAPFWLNTMAAEFLARGGEREKSRHMWLRLRQEFEPELQRIAVAQLRRLDALDQLDVINRAIEEYRKRTGSRPPDFGALSLPFRPVDDSGVPYVYDLEQGTAKLGRYSPLWRPVPDIYD
jgi:hypothetical protein